MSNSLTSHEDLTPYIESLMKISSQAASLERRRSFAADPELIIKELLTELMTTRKNTQTAEEIAKKFLEAYNTSIEDQSRLKVKISSLSSDINDLNTLIGKYQKEIEVKDSRYESITLEVIDMERALKQLNNECSQLKKERDFLKKEIQSKEQMLVIRESNMQQRKNLLVEVEKEKGKEKDKEVDKGFQIKYEQMVVSNKRKQTEIDDLVSRLHEIEALWALDKNNADKLQKSVGNLRDELFEKKIECEKTSQKYRDCKERVITLKEELIIQKAQNDSLVKEYERQKSTNFKNEFEGYEEPSIKNDAFRRSRTEILSDYFNEFEESQNSEVFFTINSSDKASPKFMLVNNKRTELLPSISVLPSKIKMKLDKQAIFNYNAKASVEAVGKIDVKGIRASKEVLCLARGNGIVYKSVLSAVNTEEIHIGRVPIFVFDDAASEESIETVASRSRKASTVEIRDPIKEFFIFTCQAAKLNSIHKDKLGTIPVNKLFERVLQQGVPFNMWHDYITDYLHARIKVKA